MSEEVTDYDRRNTEERRIAFGHALAELCNQWSMSMSRGWLGIRAQHDGYMTVAQDKTDVDGDVVFNEVLREKTDGDD